MAAQAQFDAELNRWKPLLMDICDQFGQACYGESWSIESLKFSVVLGFLASLKIGDDYSITLDGDFDSGKVVRITITAWMLVHETEWTFKPKGFDIAELSPTATRTDIEKALLKAYR